MLSGADCLEYFAGIAAGLSGEHIDLGPSAFGYTRREPLGVVAGIGAWNYPLQIACWKAAPALACGNAMIFKPAELTPLSAVKLAEIFTEAGLPDGVFNVVHGFADTGRLLTRHPDIAKVSLTGEVGTGKAVMADAAATLKHVTLELGGKSPLIVFEDADLDDAVSGALLANFYSAGEVCSNGTRVFVHESIKAPFLEQADCAGEADADRRSAGPGDPGRRADLGGAHGEGARLHRQGPERRRQGPRRRRARRQGRARPGLLRRADGVRRLPRRHGIVREEIFGPVMTVLSFADEDEVSPAPTPPSTGSPPASSPAISRGPIASSRRLQAGTCWINQYNVTPIELPFGGNKRSGLGRENGKAAIEHYTQLKSVYVGLAPIQSPY